MPTFNQYITELKPEHVLKLSELENNRENRKVALAVISTNLRSGSNFFSSTDRVSLQNLTRLVASSSIDPMNNENIKELVNEINNQKNILNKLNGSSKSKFIVETIDLAKNWLGEKI
jgi:predicted RNase H-like nuclease (RuvC/YqgF family)